MFPDDFDLKSCFAQLRGRFGIPTYVVREFASPELSVGKWQLQPAQRASMPVTTVNEHHKLESRKGQIRAPRQSCLDSIASDTEPPKGSAEGYLASRH